MTLTGPELWGGCAWGLAPGLPPGASWRWSRRLRREVARVGASAGNAPSGMIPGFEAGPLSFKLLPRSSPAAKSNSMVVRSGSGGPGPCREDTESVDLPAQGILGAPPNLCSESLAVSQSPSPAPPNSSSVGNGEGGQSAMLYPTPTQ